jgi:hypothetical protein
MKHLATHINLSRVRANISRILLRLPSPQGQISIGPKAYQYVQIVMKTIIDGRGCCRDKTLEQGSTER